MLASVAMMMERNSSGEWLENLLTHLRRWRKEIPSAENYDLSRLFHTITSWQSEFSRGKSVSQSLRGCIGIVLYLPQKYTHAKCICHSITRRLDNIIFVCNWNFVTVVVGVVGQRSSTERESLVPPIKRINCRETRAYHLIWQHSIRLHWVHWIMNVSSIDSLCGFYST